MEKRLCGEECGGGMRREEEEGVFLPTETRRGGRAIRSASGEEYDVTAVLLGTIAVVVVVTAPWWVLVVVVFPPFSSLSSARNEVLMLNNWVLCTLHTNHTKAKNQTSGVNISHPS